MQKIRAQSIKTRDHLVMITPAATPVNMVTFHEYSVVITTFLHGHSVLMSRVTQICPQTEVETIFRRDHVSSNARRHLHVVVTTTLLC